MKKYLIIFITCLFLFQLSGNRVLALAPRIYFPVILNSDYGRDLVYSGFGDSITSCYYDSNWGDFPFCGYLRGIYTRLNFKFNKNFAFFNNGIGGETTADGLARFERTLADPALYCVNPNHPAQSGGCLYPPDISPPILDLVIIMEGTNDLSNDNISYDSIEANLRGMVQLAQQHLKKVILATLAPVTGKNLYNQRIAEFNPRIRQIGIDYQVPVTDIYNAFLTFQNWETTLLGPDGLHPNQQGFEVMAEAFYQTILSEIFPTGIRPAFGWRP